MVLWVMTSAQGIYITYDFVFQQDNDPNPPILLPIVSQSISRKFARFQLKTYKSIRVRWVLNNPFTSKATVYNKYQLVKNLKITVAYLFRKMLLHTFLEVIKIQYFSEETSLRVVFKALNNIKKTLQVSAGKRWTHYYGSKKKLPLYHVTG